MRGPGRRLLQPGEEPGAEARDQGGAARRGAGRHHQARHPVRPPGLSATSSSTPTTPIGIRKPISPSPARTPTIPCASPTNSCDAVEADGDWKLTRRLDGKPAKTLKARELWDKIGYAAWASADPGLQYHTTINDWHTCPASGPIRASNPCSEYMFLDDTACNLASLNLLQFRDPDSKVVRRQSLRARGQAVDADARNLGDDGAVPVEGDRQTLLRLPHARPRLRQYRRPVDVLRHPL